MNIVTRVSQICYKSITKVSQKVKNNKQKEKQYLYLLFTHT